ncbi:MAG TPA: DUF2585 domain-containing protein [Sphingorhabdus lacus]|mgnify:FL=1|nr:DUF2585 domain-containing protein [Sphingorhabdus lacus]HPV68521.1 DUF2585 domain-containing protein [Sphingorhabdus lacus]
MEWPLRVSKFSALIALLLFTLLVAILFAMDRPPICACGEIKLWHGIVQSSENSQHIADWYTPSHIIHGFIFFGLGRLLLRKWPLGLSLCAAIFVEGAWEILENSPVIIDRYREMTISYGYSGDSIINSSFDMAWMIMGFFLASRLPWKATLALALLFEAFTGWLIRDNLTLNILMLVAPTEAVKNWQSEGSGYWLTGKVD